MPAIAKGLRVRSFDRNLNARTIPLFQPRAPMLDFVRLQQQLRGFAAYQQQQRDLLQEKLQAALEAWRQVGDVEALLEEVDRARPSWLVARPLGERLQEQVRVPSRPA